MQRVRWGVIGAGDVVQRKSGPAILAEPRSALAAITRRDVLECGARVHPDADALMADPEIDAIYIATPPDSHETLAMAAIECGKPVLIEKPIAPEATAARRIVRAAEGAKCAVSVAYYRRFDPRLVRVLSLVRAGAIGDVAAVELRQIRTDGARTPPAGWRADMAVSPGGRFSDSHSHALDWLTHAFGPPRLVTGAPARSGLVAYALQLRDAPVAGIFDPVGDTEDDRLIITGEAGTITAPFFDPGPVVLQRTGAEKGRVEVDISPPRFGHLPLFSAMAAHLLDGAPPPCPAGEAMGATEIISKLFAA